MIARAWLLALALVVAGAPAARAGEDAPAALALPHEVILAPAARFLRNAEVTYTEDRVVIRGYRRRYGFWWPIRGEAHFARAAGRVHLELDAFFVSGRRDDDRKAEAAAAVARIVDRPSAAPRVVVEQDGRVVFEQEVTDR